MSNESYANLEAAVSDAEKHDVVLVDSVLKKLLQEGSGRGYIIVKTDPAYQLHGFKSLGIGYKKVSDSPSLDDHLAPGDLEVVRNSVPGDTKLVPFIKYGSPDHQVISDPEMMSFMNYISADHFFILDNGGGETVSMRQLEKMRGLQKVGYIASVSENYLKSHGMLKEEDIKPDDTHEV